MKKPVLYSIMWALCYRLDAQFPNFPARKIKGRMLQAYQSYSIAEKDVIEQLKAQAWSRIEERFEGVLSLPIVITQLYWAFPDVYGPKIGELIDMMNDVLVDGIDDMELIGKSSEVSEWLVEVIEDVATKSLVRGSTKF